MFRIKLDFFPKIGLFWVKWKKIEASWSPKKTMHFYKNRRESRLVILLDYSCISLQLCADIIWRTLLCSVLFPMHFFARHPTTYEVHSYFFMRQRGNSVIVFCECNIVKRKTVCTTPQCWLLLQLSKNSGKKKGKKCPYKIVAKGQNVTCRKYNVVLLCNAFGKSNPERKKKTFSKEGKKRKGVTVYKEWECNWK